MEVHNFLEILYGGSDGGWHTLNFFPDRKTVWFKAGHEPPRFDVHQNCYLGIGLRKEKLSDYHRGDINDIIGIPGLWLDLDYGDDPNAHKAKSLPPCIEDCITLLDSAPLQPSLMIHSGHGLQAYWIFKEVWYFDDDKEREYAAILNTGWQRWFQDAGRRMGWHVDSTADLARVFRIPGTYNCKTEPAILVTVLQHNSCRYEPSDFDDYISQPSECQHKTKGGISGDLLPLSDRIQYLIKHGDSLGRYASRSEAVFAAISAMIRARYAPDDICYTLLNPDNALSESPIQKGEPWLRKEIERACSKGARPLDESYHNTEQVNGADPTRFRDRFDQASYSEITAGKHLIEEYGQDIHYIHAWKIWIVYQDGTWKRDESGTIQRHGKDIIAKIGHEAKRWISNLLEIDDEEITGMRAKQIDDLAQDIASKGGEEKHKSTMIEIGRAKNFYQHSLRITSKLSEIVENARTETGVHLPVEHLDQHPFKLVCKNGVINLKTGELMSFNRDDLITKSINITYDPDAKAPRWEHFLLEIMGYPIQRDNPDMSKSQLDQRSAMEKRASELVAYLQRAIGYSLTGSVREQVMFVLHGSGANGKSLFISTLMKLFGELSKKATQRLLMHKRNDHDHPTEIADLFGKRFVAAVETAEDQRLDEVFIKEATGDDRITARHMNENFWEFNPTHKLWLATNHKPQIRDVSHAMWRRLHLIPFEVTFQMPNGAEADTSIPIADLNLPDMLLSELPGILTWAVQGSINWYQSGLMPPDSVQKATDQYRHEQDVFGEFIEECCDTSNPQSDEKFKDLWEAFKVWADDSNRYAGTKNAFGRRLSSRGFEKGQEDNQRVYKAIKLKESAKPKATYSRYRDDSYAN